MLVFVPPQLQIPHSKMLEWRRSSLRLRTPRNKKQLLISLRFSRHTPCEPRHLQGSPHLSGHHLTDRHPASAIENMMRTAATNMRIDLFTFKTDLEYLDRVIFDVVIAELHSRESPTPHPSGVGPSGKGLGPEHDWLRV